jgi:hypothetical protein
MPPVTDNPISFNNLYAMLKEHLIAAYNHFKREKFVSLWSHPKMGAHEQPYGVLSRLNTLKPLTL